MKANPPSLYTDDGYPESRDCDQNYHPLEHSPTHVDRTQLFLDDGMPEGRDCDDNYVDLGHPKPSCDQRGGTEETPASPDPRPADPA
ncbi:MAG: hypothetical protein VYE77_04185 [Planctomycetota bacterium]|nr:hypothetical protein [Planctomycetota bacterium]